jgi:hypothetical protein
LILPSLTGLGPAASPLHKDASIPASWWVFDHSSSSHPAGLERPASAQEVQPGRNTLLDRAEPEEPGAILLHTLPSSTPHAGQPWLLPAQTPTRPGIESRHLISEHEKLSPLTSLPLLTPEVYRATLWSERMVAHSFRARILQRVVDRTASEQGHEHENLGHKWGFDRMMKGCKYGCGASNRTCSGFRQTRCFEDMSGIKTAVQIQ